MATDIYGNQTYDPRQDELDKANAYMSQAVANLSQIATVVGNEKKDQRNFQYQVDTDVKNEALLREAWARDDTAVQRKVKDLKDAGLSPLLAAGSAAGNTSPIQLNAPQYRYQMNGADLSSQLSALSLVQNIKANQLRNEGQKIANDNAKKQGKILDLDIDNYGLPWQAQIANRLIEALTGMNLFQIINNPNYNLSDLVHDVGVGVENFTGAGVNAKSTPLPSQSSVAQKAVDLGYASVGADGQIYFKSGVDWQNFFVKVLGGTTQEWYYGIRKYKSPEAFVRSLM